MELGSITLGHVSESDNILKTMLYISDKNMFNTLAAVPVIKAERERRGKGDEPTILM